MLEIGKSQTKEIVPEITDEIRAYIEEAVLSCGGDEADVTDVLNKLQQKIYILKREKFITSSKLFHSFVTNILKQKQAELLSEKIEVTKQSKKKKRLITPTGVGVTLIGLGLDAYYLLLVANNPRSVRIEQNPISDTFLFVTVLPLYISMHQVFRESFIRILAKIKSRQ